MYGNNDCILISVQFKVNTHIITYQCIQHIHIICVAYLPKIVNIPEKKYYNNKTGKKFNEIFVQYFLL